MTHLSLNDALKLIPFHVKCLNDTLQFIPFKVKARRSLNDTLFSLNDAFKFK